MYSRFIYVLIIANQAVFGNCRLNDGNKYISLDKFGYVGAFLNVSDCHSFVSVVAYVSTVENQMIVGFLMNVACEYTALDNCKDC